MFASQNCDENGLRRLPRAPLRSRAEYLEFCRCLLDEPGHERWQVLLRELGCPAPDDWIAYAAKYATLPPLPAHLALPAPVWSFLSVVLLDLQPTLLNALAQHMAWPMPTQPTPPNAIHFTGFSAGSYTAIALEAEYRLLSQRFQQPLCPGCATLGALGCPITYLLALLQPHYCAGDHQLVSNARTVRIIHLWDDQLCPWNPSLAELQAVTTSVHPTLPIPSVLIQLLDTGTGPRRPKWLEADTHNYAHLLQATVPRHPALLAVKATLPELCAYSATFAPPDALEELTAYLLSWAASAAPFQPLTAAQMQRAADV